MTVKLLCVSTGPHSDAILHALLRQSAGEVELVLHLGGTDSDYKASAISRMDRRRGRRGHFAQGAPHSGLAHGLFLQPDFDERIDEGIDHLHRRSEPHVHLPHRLRTFHEYWDYYHVMADVMARRIEESGATHMLFFNIPHLVFDTLALQVGRSMGLKSLMLAQSPFANRFLSMPDIPSYGRLTAGAQLAAAQPIDRGETPQHFYMKGIGQERARTGRLSARAVLQLVVFLVTRRPGRALDPRYVAGLLSRMRQVAEGLPDWRDPFARFFHEDALAYFEHLLEFEEQPPDWSRRFVYFPLQLQPEMTTSALGGPFKDQALAIEALARLLPEDVAIYVKENPKQGSYMRGPMFFHRLKRIPGLVFMPSHASTHELTARAEFVASISGTAGWEAVRKGKPALVFGPTWYAGFPGVHRYHDGLRFEDIVGQPPDHGALEQALGQLLSQAHEGVVERHYKPLVPGFDESLNTEAVARAILPVLTGRAPSTFA